MQVAVTFRHMKTNDGIKDYVQGKVQRLQKYVGSPKEVHVVLSTEKFRQIAEITIIADGLTFNSQAKNSDLYAAIDQMVDKMERQIRERRGKERRKRPPVTKAVAQSAEQMVGGSEDAELISLIQRRRVLAKPMSLEEAVAQLGVAKREFLVFINSDSGQMNVLYRSKDGGFEWVEPHAK